MKSWERQIKFGETAEKREWESGLWGLVPALYRKRR